MTSSCSTSAIHGVIHFVLLPIILFEVIEICIFFEEEAEQHSHDHHLKQKFANEHLDLLLLLFFVVVVVVVVVTAILVIAVAMAAAVAQEVVVVAVGNS